MFINFFGKEPPLLESDPQGDESVEVVLDERAEKCVRSLLALESFEISHTLAALYMAGVNSRKAQVDDAAPPPQPVLLPSTRDR